MREHVWNLRSRRCFAIVELALARANRGGDIRLVHFSVQGNHIHLLVETRSTAALSSGLKGLSVRLARGLNRLMQQSGPVLADRYHAHVLRTPREVRRVLAYVLENFRSHATRRGEQVPSGWRDLYSSAALSPGSADGPPTSSTSISPPRTWLLRKGWRPPAGSRSEPLGQHGDVAPT